MQQRPQRHQPPKPYVPSTDLPVQEYDNTPDYETGTMMHQLRDALALLDTRLRPLTGHINVHPMPGDVVSFASYNLTANADPIQIVGNQPHGVLCTVLINANASCHISTTRETSLTSAFRIPANVLVTLPASADLWLFTDTGTPFVSVAVITYDLPA